VSISSRIALVAVLLITAACGASIAVLQRLVDLFEDELVRSESALARVLGSVKKRGRPDFDAIRAFVAHSDRRDVSLGLVYAIEVDGDGRMVDGELNPRLFASLGPSFQRLVLEGRTGVLRRLAADKVDRGASIREVAIEGRLRLGFDLGRIDRLVREARQSGLIVIGLVWLVGLGLALLLSRWTTGPLRRLASQVTAVAAGDLHQQVAGGKGLEQIAQPYDQLRRMLAAQVDVREQLGPYLGDSITERILREPNPLEISAEERAVTVMAVGFRGLSTLQGDLSSTEALRLANEYLAPVIDAITDHGGAVVQLDSARVLAVWGFPQPVKEPERGAIKAALAVRAGVRLEGRRQAAIGGAVLEPCTGIASGRATGGNLGSARRVAYTVTGAAVEVGCLIEQQSQPGEILVNEAAFDKVRGVVTGQGCAPLIAEGMEEAMPLYRLE